MGGVRSKMEKIPRGTPELPRENTGGNSYLYSDVQIGKITFRRNLIAPSCTA